MPTFPTYDGELPSCLNPWNPRHYLLVLYWVYFRPTAMCCYLYRADPEIYKSKREWVNFKLSLQNCSYQNLYIIQALLPFISGLIFLSIRFFESNNLDFQNLFEFLIFNIKEILILIIGSISICMAMQISSNLNTFFVYNVPVGIALSTIFVVQPGSLSEVLFGVITGLGSRIFFHLESKNLVVFNQILIIVASFSLTAFVLDKELSFIFLFSTILGVVGFPIYIIQIFNLFYYRLFKRNFPTDWDELIFIPMFSLDQHLLYDINRDEKKGLIEVSKLVGNTFQAWAVQSSVWSYLLDSRSPIECIYYWSTSKELGRFARIPLSENQWNFNISSWQMVLTELINLPLDNYGFIASRIENAPRIFTSWLRFSVRRDSHNKNLKNDLKNIMYLFLLCSFSENHPISKSLDNFSDSNNLIVDDFSNLTRYVYGFEVQTSLKTIFTYLKFQTFEHVATAYQCIDWLNYSDVFLRPTVISVIQSLSIISQEIYRALIATSRTNRLSAIALANDRLLQLRTYITETVPSGYPEHKLLLRITRQWQEIITQAGGTAAREQLLTPVSNPYVAGNPVTGKLFVGRDDILQRIEELWTQPDQLSSSRCLFS